MNWKRIKAGEYLSEDGEWRIVKEGKDYLIYWGTNTMGASTLAQAKKWVQKQVQDREDYQRWKQEQALAAAPAVVNP